MEYRFRIIVMPRKDLLDPQGRAVKMVINDMGIDVKDVRIGKSIEVIINAENEEEAVKIVKDLSGKIFSNPIIEDYTIERI